MEERRRQFLKLTDRLATHMARGIPPEVEALEQLRALIDLLLREARTGEAPPPSPYQGKGSCSPGSK